MKLKTWTLVCSIALSMALSADEPKKPAAMSDQQKAEMEAMMKAATPGEMHKKLDSTVGDWNAKVSMWMAPGMKPQVSSGTATRKWVLGKRYVEERFSGNFMNKPFHGVGYTGYDNLKKEYFGTWMDDMGTGVMMTTGTRDDDKTWTFKGSMPDPTSGKDTPVEEKIIVKDKDHHTMEMYSPGPDGKMF